MCLVQQQLCFVFFWSFLYYSRWFVFAVAENVYEAQRRLETVLFENYYKKVRPVVHHSDNVTVTVGLSLSRIQDMVSFIAKNVIEFFGGLRIHNFKLSL